MKHIYEIRNVNAANEFLDENGHIYRMEFSESRGYVFIKRARIPKKQDQQEED